MTDVVRLGERGRLVLPAGIRHHLGLDAGDDLLVFEEDSGIRLLPRRAAAHALIGTACNLPADDEGSAVDELLAERRREAAMEDRDAFPPEHEA